MCDIVKVFCLHFVVSNFDSGGLDVKSHDIENIILLYTVMMNIHNNIRCMSYNPMHARDAYTL